MGYLPKRASLRSPITLRSVERSGPYRLFTHCERSGDDGAAATMDLLGNPTGNRHRCDGQRARGYDCHSLVY
jgi:hypothetical protein